MDAETRRFLRHKLETGLAELARLAYPLDLDSTDFGRLASDAFKTANQGAAAPRGRYIPPREHHKGGSVKKVWCPACKLWTACVEIDTASGEKVHGGRRGCRGPVQVPDEDGMVPVPPVGVDDEGGEE